MRRLVWSLACLLALVGCTPKPVAPDEPQPLGTIRIATATKAGVYFPVGEAMARLWNERIPSAKAEVMLTAGSAENFDLLLGQEADVAFAQSGVAYSAGEGGSQVRSTLRGLTHLYPNVMQLAVRKDSGIKDIVDLVGKRLVPGIHGSATLINAQELLALYGMSLSDMTVEHMGYGEAAAALIEGRADATLVAGGLPTEAVRTLLESGEAELLPLDAAAIVKKYPWYYPYSIPAGSYPGQTEEVRTVAVANILIARADMPEEHAYELVRTLYEGQEQLRASHPAADLKLEQALRGITGVLPLHPGAARYFREVGVLR
ncbi:MAG TPA: TAXI family TRAP transporter solute-binding subunit [Symbiobacteriaceae bacterium]|nr:TAXI family TRAP transporter solute-binding subunit [Symbiobacteriaceae bacterium]